MASGPFVTDRGAPFAGAEGLIGSVDIDSVVGLVVRCLGGVAGIAAVACGGMLLARRLTAAITDVPGPAALLTVAGLGGLLVIAADRSCRYGGGLVGPVAARIGLAAALAAMASAPQTVTGGIAFVVAVAAAAITMFRRPWRYGTGAEPVGELRSPPPFERPRRPGRRIDRHGARSAAPTRGVERRRKRAFGRTRQRFARYELPDGGDAVRGRITITVPAGAKSAHGHVGFCPAFGETPRVSVTTDYDGVEATVLAAEVLPWGVRIECRLAEPAEEPLEIPVDLAADAVPQV